jgi:DNA polymerase I-like protein with 3'-5' exonuclease and polymerase domains
MSRARRRGAARLDRPIGERGYVAVDTETTGLNEMTADLVGVSLASSRGRPATSR